MIDEIETPEDGELDLTPPDFLDRSSPEVIEIVEKGRALTLDARRAELARATAPKMAASPSKPKAGSATAMAAKSKAETPAPKTAKVAKPAKPSSVVAGKKSDAEMIALIKEHREAAGGTAGKTLKVLRDKGISCSQERFKKLYASAS